MAARQLAAHPPGSVHRWKCWFLQVQTDPRLSSSSGSNWNIVVADKTVILFDQSYQAILLLLHFGGLLGNNVPMKGARWALFSPCCDCLSNSKTKFSVKSHAGVYHAICNQCHSSVLCNFYMQIPQLVFQKQMWMPSMSAWRDSFWWFVKETETLTWSMCQPEKSFSPRYEACLISVLIGLMIVEEYMRYDHRVRL